jgi:exodeoxyribonuclease V alpha subunit
LQFKADSIRTTVPTTLEGREKYLGSGMIKGIGPVYAKKLVTAFGQEVFDIIEREPARLREVTGIGPGREAKIIRGWTDQRAIREIIVWLYSQGVSSTRAVRIFKTYGEEAIAVIMANPYRLARDITGIGFKTADAIAASLGYGKDDPRRVRAGVAHALTTAMDDGHCGLPRDDLIRSGAELLEVPAARKRSPSSWPIPIASPATSPASASRPPTPLPPALAMARTIRGGSVPVSPMR